MMASLPLQRFKSYSYRDLKKDVNLRCENTWEDNKDVSVSAKVAFSNCDRCVGLLHATTTHLCVCSLTATETSELQPRVSVAGSKSHIKAYLQK